MANNQNTGFRPAYDLVGNRLVRHRFPVDVANGTAVFVGDIVANNAAGSVRPAAADAGVTAVGVCVALSDSNGVSIGSPGSSVSTKYLPASTAGYADVVLALPGAVFVAPAGATAFAAADIFCSADHVATAGSTTTARSGHVLNGSSKNTEAQFQILGKVESPDNEWGTYVDLYVRFMESVFGQVNPTTGV